MWASGHIQQVHRQINSIASLVLRNILIVAIIPDKAAQHAISTRDELG